MKRGMIAMSVLAMMGLNSVVWADNMTERFASHIRYTEYQKALDANDKEKAVKRSAEVASF